MHVIKYQFIRQCVEDKKIDIVYVRTEDELADIITKALGKLKFQEMRGRIGVRSIHMEEQEQGGDWRTCSCLVATSCKVSPLVFFFLFRESRFPKTNTFFSLARWNYLPSHMKLPSFSLMRWISVVRKPSIPPLFLLLLLLCFRSLAWRKWILSHGNLTGWEFHRRASSPLPLSCAGVHV